MAVRSRFQKDEGTPDINLSPMIDCIFILLIFFIVTTVFVEEFGLMVNKPEASSAESLEDNENILIEITETGKIVYEGKEVELGTLGGQIKTAVLRDEDIPVSIQAHKEAKQGQLAKVWSQAVSAGAKNLSYTTTSN